MPLTGEALCPYCARFVDTLAARIHEDGVMNLTKFRYIPYGNAKDTKASSAPASSRHVPSRHTSLCVAAYRTVYNVSMGHMSVISTVS